MEEPAAASTCSVQLLKLEMNGIAIWSKEEIGKWQMRVYKLGSKK